MKVSAIITTFNRAELLRKAITSILNQTYKDFELLILNNNSSDNTEQVIRSFNDSRIVYIKHKPLSISEARSLGVQKAQGEFVGFLDDDDEWLPEKLSLQVALFDRSPPTVGLVYGGFIRVTPDGKIYEKFTPSLRGDVLESYLCDRDPLTGSASNPLIRRDAFSVVGGYDNNLKTSEDWEFYLRLARKYEFNFVPEPVIKIREHTGARLGDRLKDAAEAELLVYKNFQDILQKNKQCKSFYLQAIGGKYCRIGETKEGRKYLRQAIRANPFNAIAYGQYLLSFLGQGFYSRAHRLYKNNF